MYANATVVSAARTLFRLGKYSLFYASGGSETDCLTA